MEASYRSFISKSYQNSSSSCHQVLMYYVILCSNCVALILYVSCSLPVFYRSTNDIHSVLSNVIDLPGIGAVCVNEFLCQLCFHYAADSTGLILRDQLLMKIASQLTDVSASQPFVTTVK